MKTLKLCKLYDYEDNNNGNDNEWKGKAKNE